MLLLSLVWHATTAPSGLAAPAFSWGYVMISKRTSATRRAFSLVEMAVVMVIVGVLAAIAVPRVSRAGSGAKEAALRQELKILRSAIELYSAEHGGQYPSVGNFEEQLTLYTDFDGDAQPTPDTTHIFGPYLTKVPELPAGEEEGSSDVGADESAGKGWVFDAAAGTIKANAGEATDSRGVKLRDY